MVRTGPSAPFVRRVDNVNNADTEKDKGNFSGPVFRDGELI